MSLTKWILLAISSVILTVGCGSSKIKERKDQRDRLAQSSKLYCEFVNGEVYPDLDVALNIQMANKCDLEKPFSLTQYKTPTENPGVIYCCNTAGGKNSATSRKSEKADTKKSDETVE